MDEIECIVIGAGVVGLACAAAIARSGREVLVLEAENAIGTHTSSRNSEVIHAGIYYEPGSLKAELCRRGNHQLYAYAKDRGIPFLNTGKLIVACSEGQVNKLEAIRRNAIANDVDDIELMTPQEANRLEPAVTCNAALFSPSTGIIDSHAYMLALAGELEAYGGMIGLQTRVSTCDLSEDRIIVTTGGENALRLNARHVINCAGLMAPAVARSMKGLKENSVPQTHYAIGHYYRLTGRSPCQRPVYPLPEPGGLGIHLTVDLGGQAKFGPDVRWIDKIDYSFDDSRFGEFVSAIQAYLPELQADRLAPDYTGIRPKIVGAGQPAADFRIDGAEVHGCCGVVNLFGIESPGLTASLAIGDHVADLVRRSG
jgi:L-2-hydroxyglutarate oxidase LhgO